MGCTPESFELFFQQNTHFQTPVNSLTIKILQAH